MLNNNMINLISFLGLIIGYILALNVKEELILGKKYFNLFEKLILIILIVFAIKLNYLFFLGLLIGVIINYFIRRVYLFLGIISLIPNFIILVFLFGLFHGTLNYIKFRKINYKDILINLILFIIPLIINIKNDLFIGIGIGGIIIGIFGINSRFKKEKRVKRFR